MRHTSVDVYKSCKHVYETVQGLEVFKGMENHFLGSDALNRVKTVGAFVAQEPVWNNVTDKISWLVWIDNGLETLGVIMTNEDTDGLEYGQVLQVEVMAYRNVDKTVNNKMYKAVSYEVLGEVKRSAETVEEVVVEGEAVAGVVAVEEVCVGVTEHTAE